MKMHEKVIDDSAWRLSPKSLHLDFGEVHVWRATLTQSAERVEELRNLLSTGEIIRAGKFHFPVDRRKFIVTRGVLRSILSRYLSRRPEQLSFIYNSFGKPELPDSLGALSLRFNLSHAENLVLYALACGSQVGIDVEYLRDNFDGGEIAEHFFSDREVAMLNGLPPDQKTRGFFKCWTRKEAYVKARGFGLSFPFESFDVSHTLRQPTALLCANEGARASTFWSLLELEPGPNYIASVVVEGRPCRLRCWDWQDSL